jgi:hypothetical protein
MAFVTKGREDNQDGQKRYRNIKLLTKRKTSDGQKKLVRRTEPLVSNEFIPCD